MHFEVAAQDTCSKARLGRLTTCHGVVETPVFMPVGTLGTVKALAPRDLKELGVQMLLANTYHLQLRPGSELIQELGGLHQFMGWDGPILTDSGGFQVYSLSRFRKVDDHGVSFQSHLDGKTHYLTPERVLDFQAALGSDIWMPLDECVSYPVDQEAVEISVTRTTQWGERSKRYFQQIVLDKEGGEGTDRPLLFGIVQGGMDREQRRISAEALTQLDFDGYAIGGLCVGEPLELTFQALEAVLPFLPADKPRYFMGLGTPREIERCIALGVDLFDSVVPTRFARHGSVLTAEGTVSLKNQRFTRDRSPIEERCDCYACQHFSRAYLRHLLMSNEILAMTLLSLHNIAYLTALVTSAKQNISLVKEGV